MRTFPPVPHPYYDSQMRQQGFSETTDRLAELMPQGKTAEAMRIIPEEVVDTLTISGTPAGVPVTIEYEGVTEHCDDACSQKDEALGCAKSHRELISETKSSSTPQLCLPAAPLR